MATNLVTRMANYPRTLQELVLRLFKGKPSLGIRLLNINYAKLDFPDKRNGNDNFYRIQFLKSKKLSLGSLLLLLSFFRDLLILFDFGTA